VASNRLSSAVPGSKSGRRGPSNGSNARSEEELSAFVRKLRVFDILGQDDAGAWLAKNFSDLFYIRATGVYGWQPPKNGSYQKTEIQNHG
jgi:hypothetical protein